MVKSLISVLLLTQNKESNYLIKIEIICTNFWHIKIFSRLINLHQEHLICELFGSVGLFLIAHFIKYTISIIIVSLL